MVANEKPAPAKRPEAPKTPKLAAKAPGTPKLVKTGDKKTGPMANGTANGKATPKDFRYNPSQGGSLLGQRDFRVQGYADANFERPRPRLTQSIETENPSSQNKNFGVPNWLDTIKPKIYGEGKGLQYGSDRAPVSDPSQAKPIRNPFNDKTSAELDKYRKLQMEVDRDIALFREEKMRKINQREQEKREDLDMLRSYHPWGKPGGGAPFHTDNEHKKQKFPTDGKTVDSHEHDFSSFHQSFGRPGAGAPLRTESGRLKAELTTASDIRFQDSQDGKLMMERSLRYKNDSSTKQHYSQALEKQLQEKALNNQELRIQELKKELEMIKHDPYGKPGAGAPNFRRTDDGTVNAARRNTLSADVVEMRKIERKERELGLGSKNFDPPPQKQQELAEYDPWGKGYGVPQRDEHGEVRRHRFSDKNYGVFTNDAQEENTKMNSLPMSSSIGGAGAPIKSQDGEIMTRIPITMKRNERGDTSVREEMNQSIHRPSRELSDPELQVYDPWGRSGAGAPLRDSHGHAVAQFTGKVNAIRGEDSADASQRALAKQLYLKELQQGIEDQRAAREFQERELKHGGGDLAAVMRQGQVGRPRRDPDTGMLVSQPIKMSDVTRGGFQHLSMTHKANRNMAQHADMEKADKRSMKDEKSHLYHTELENAAEERRRNRMLDRVKDQQESMHHQLSFDALWGRPGAGAPLQQGYKKLNIDRLIQQPNDTPMGDPSPDEFWGRPGAGAPNAHGNRKANLDEMLRLPDIYNGSDPNAGDPWGKEGSGAPLQQSTRGKLNLEKLLHGSIQNQPNHDNGYDTFWGRPGAGAPLPQGTKKVNLDKILRLPDIHNGNDHQSTFDTFWGKPGAGAPNDKGTKKAKLDDILHSPRKDPDSYYSKVLDEEHPPQNYVRSTISSNHVNMFEMSTAKRAEPQKPNYNLVTPWASEEVY